MSITVRAYNVLFGDCILVSWDEDDGKHHAWVDFGNFHNDPNPVFTKVYADVRTRTKGRLDLVVITHRHLDHLEGFHVLRDRFAKDFQIQRVWHAHVTKQTDNLFKLAQDAVNTLLPAAALRGAGEIGRIYRNNFGDLGLTTKDRMKEIIEDFPVKSSHFHKIHRKMNLKSSGALPPGLKRLSIKVLAPEEESGVYLKPLEEMLALRSRIAFSFPKSGRVSPLRSRGDPFAATRAVPAERSPLMQLADFARLRRQLRTGGLDILAAADNTRNNTSIVMRWSYDDVRLLFTGDAEEMSWEVMRKNGADLSAKLIKVGHHGSINASPAWSFATVLPKKLAANAAVLSTDPQRFTGENEVPKAEVVAGWSGRLKGQTRFKRTDKVQLGESVAVTFSD